MMAGNDQQAVMDRAHAYFDSLRALGDQYFAFWTDERAVIMATHKSDCAALSAHFGVSLQAISDALGPNPNENDVFAAASREPFNEDNQVLDWLMTDNGYFGSPFGYRLCVGVVSIFAPTEIVAFDPTEKNLRDAPPVYLRWHAPTNDDPMESPARLGSHLAVCSLRHPGVAIARDDMPQGPVRDRFDTLVAAIFEVRPGTPSSVGFEGPAVRSAYHSFAPTFHSWLTGVDRAPVPSQKQQHGPGQFENSTSLLVPSAVPFQRGFIPSVMRGHQWALPPDDSPSWRNDSEDLKCLVYLGDVKPGGPGITAARAAELQTIFKSVVDPKTVVLFGACMSLWIQARQKGTVELSGSVRIHVNSLLGLFGYQKHPKGGYQLAHKREFSARLQNLNSLNADYRYVNDQGRQKRMMGNWVNVTLDDDVDLFGNAYPCEFLVRPGDASFAFVAGAAQLMNVYTALAPLFKSGKRKDDIAARIGVYLCGLFRTRESHPDQYQQALRIKTMLDNSHVEIEANPGNHGRFKEIVEEALDILIGKVYAGWQYRTDDVERIEKSYGAFRAWLGDEKKGSGAAVIFTPLPDVIERSAIRTEARQTHIQSAKRRKTRVR